MNRDETIEKIKKLLRLSESPNENEALLAATKARELLSSYNISLSELGSDDLFQKLGIVEIETTDIFTLEEWVVSLGYHIAKIFDCRALARGELLRPGKVVFVGTRSDTEVASYTFEFLRRRVEELATEAVRTRREEIRGIDENTYRQTYLVGAVQRIREDLVVRSLVFKKKEKNKCNALVVRKQENLDNYLKEKYPNLATAESVLFDLDRESFYRGYAQAKGIQINEAVRS